MTIKKLYVADTTAVLSYFSNVFNIKCIISRKSMQIMDEAFSPYGNTALLIPSIVFIEIHEKWCKNEEITKKIYYEVFHPINKSNNIEITPIEKEILIHFVNIDDDIINLENHDKLILATALNMEATIITTDDKIKRYLRKKNSIEYIE